MNVLNFIMLLIIISKLVLIKSDSVGVFKTIHTGPKPIWNDTHVDRLKKHLLVNYDRFMRPEHDYNPTQLNLSLTILHLETDENKAIISVDSWIKLIWTDSKLKWNKDDYGGLNEVNIADHEVWQPDIYLYNSVGGGEQLSRAGSKNVIVYADGKVLWVPSVKLTALCDFNLRYWPFDVQKCFLKFGSWTYSKNELNLGNNTYVQIEDTATAGSWIVEATAELTEKQYPCCTELYQAMLYKLNLTRKSTPYTAIIVTPAVVSTFLILTQFWLPPYTEEKIILNGFTVVLLNMFLLYFNHQVYTAGTQTPLLVLFYSSSLYIAGFSMVSSVITYLICKVRKTKPLPGCIKKTLKGSLGKWLLVHFEADSCQGRAREEIKDDETECVNEHLNKKYILRNLIQEEWVTLAVCIDRLLFVILILIFVILAIRFS